MQGTVTQSEERPQVRDGWQRMRHKMQLEKRIRELQDEIKRLERERQELG